MTIKPTASIFLLFLLTFPSYGQVQLRKVPKQYSFELGYRNTMSIKNFDNRASNGFSLLADYAWQLSGLDKSSPAIYLSVPLGYEWMAADNPSSDMDISFIMYGWTIRHELAKNKNAIPYIGYALLLNRMHVQSIEGSVMGHQTRFEAGCNLNSLNKIKYFIKIEYSYTSYPSLGVSEKISLHSLCLKSGIRLW